VWQYFYKEKRVDISNKYDIIKKEAQPRLVGLQQFGLCHISGTPP